MKKFADNIPIYLQLKQEMEDAILNGRLKTDEVVQSIRALAMEYTVNPLTVSKAISELEDEGVIYKKRGIGFFVAHKAQENLRRKRLQSYLESEVKHFVKQATQLGIELSEITELIKKAYEEECHATVSGN